MKKKILSTLLAVCLFVGAAVPAVLADYTSTQAGDGTKISGIKFAESTYTIKQNESKDFAGEVRVFESDKKLVLDANQVKFSLEGADVNFAINGSEVTAINNTGSATLVATDDATGKVIEKIKITAAVNPKAQVATSFKYAATTNTVVYDAATGAKSEGATVKVMPIPAGRKFTDRNKVLIAVAAAQDISAAAGTVDVEAWDATSGAAITTLYNAAAPTDAEINAAIAQASAVTLDGDGNIVIALPKADLTNAKYVTVTDAAFKENLKVATTVKFTDKDGKNAKDVKATTNIKPVVAKNYETIGMPSAKTIEVGQEINLADLVKLGASDANVKADKSWSIAAKNDTADVDDYAALNSDSNGKVLGVAVGTNKVIVTLGVSGKSAECLVTVVPAGSIKTAPDAASMVLTKTATVFEGKTAQLYLKNAPKDAKIVWASKDAKVATVDAKGVVTGVKAGTVDVTATVNGTVLTSKVTVKAAEAGKPGDKPSTNPATADSLFANLF